MYILAPPLLPTAATKYCCAAKFVLQTHSEKQSLIFFLNQYCSASKSC